jgi:serine O-acetyltransferase
MVTPRRHAFHTSDGWREISGDGAHPGDAIPPDPVAQRARDEGPVPCPRCEAGAGEGAARGGLLERARRGLATMVEDVDAAMHNDPAARSRAEVALTYPGVHALWLHRVAHGLFRRGHPLAARAVSETNRFVTGIEIHPGATFGHGVFIDHGMGIVIGETAYVGDGCLLYKGVVLGGTSLERTVRHPHLGRNVVVGSNASVLGGIHLGDGAKVGSGSVVIRDVPAGATVVGVPGRVVIDEQGRRVSALADHAHADLPDPVSEALGRLTRRIEALEAELAAARGDGADTPDPAAP